MEQKDIQVGKSYRGKRFQELPFGGNNDRTVLWISSSRLQVQYDSDTVRIGRYHPTTTMEKFLKWASCEAPKG